ncbi:YD repeat-containing protein|nr:YD repeat-containing protein [Enterobacter ludwigii]
MDSSRPASSISAVSDSTAAQTATTTEPSLLEGSAEKVTHNCLTQLNGIRWRYDIHGRTVEKDNGQTRWHYCYDGEHRLTEVIRQPRDRNKPQTQVSFRYDPLGRQLPLRSAWATHQQNATPDAGRTANRQAGHHPVCLGRVPSAAGGARGCAADQCLQRSGQLRSAGACRWR